MAADERELYAAIERGRRNEWRLGALDEWRKDLDGRVAILESKVNDLRFSDAVAEALSERLERKRRLELTLMQKLAGGCFALLLVLLPVALERLLP